MTANIVIFVSALLLIHLHAEIEAEARTPSGYLNTMFSCYHLSGLTEVELAQMALSNNVLDNEKKRCMYACTYKAAGMMNEKGMIDIDVLKEITMERYAGHPDAMQKTLEFIELCKSVNDEPVSDGEKGCDRAALLFECSEENSPKLPVNLDWQD